MKNIRYSIRLATSLICLLPLISALGHAQTRTESECLALSEQGKHAEFQQCLDDFFAQQPEFVVDSTYDLMSKAVELMVGDTMDQGLGIQYYLQAAQSGNSKAQFEMGTLYYDAEHVPKDLEQAFYWLSKSAEQQNALGQVMLGQLYQEEAFSKKDGQKSIYWLTQAVKNDNRLAAYLLGNTYYQGVYAPKDLNKAFEWYKKAANMGYPEAILQMAVFYANGYGMPKNPAKAEEILEELLPYPHTPQAFTQVARWYERGEEGFPKDQAIALYWYKKAAELAQTETDQH